MHILYFYQYFGTRNSSYSTRVYEFTRRWAQAGDKVTVVTSLYDKSDLKPTGLLTRFDIEGIDVRVINVGLSNKHGFVRRIFTFLAYAVLSCWYALRLKADVVVCSSGPLTVGIPGLVARYLRRVPLVFEVRDIWPEGAIQLGVLRNRFVIACARLLERCCYRSARLIVPVSQGMADWILERYPGVPVAVIPHGSDTDWVAQLDRNLVLPAWADGKRLVLYTGTVGLMDDCMQIVEMGRVLHERGVTDVSVVLIGDGGERATLEAHARGLNLTNMHFLGNIPKHQVMRWLLHARCALFTVKDVPILGTVSPNKLYDAFAAGVPVVQVSSGWIKDLFDREECGLNVPINDPPAMADAVMRIASDEALYLQLAESSLRVGRELFDRTRLAAQYRARVAEAAGKPLLREPVRAAVQQELTT